MLLFFPWSLSLTYQHSATTLVLLPGEAQSKFLSMFAKSSLCLETPGRGVGVCVCVCAYTYPSHPLGMLIK